MVRCAILSSLLFLMASSVSAATLDEVEKTLGDKLKTYKSFSYDSVMISKSSTPQYSSDLTMKTKTEMLQKNNTWLMRSETETTGKSIMMGKTTDNNSTSLSINDGTYQYILNKTAAGTQATKSKVKKAPDTKPFAHFKQMYEMKLVGEETFNGIACYVIECVTKMNIPNTPKTPIKHYYSKAHGFPVGYSSKSADGKTVNEMKVSNIKTNPSIPESRFVFKAPEGVKVTEY